MRIILILSLISLLFGGPVFGEPTIWPQSLDELYHLIDTGQGNWVFTQPCPEHITGPVLTWRDAKNLHSDDEDALFYRGAVEYLFGDLQACKPPDDKVLFYGPALAELLALTER